MAFDAAAEAQKLRKAMKGMGSDEGAMINVLCKLSNAELQEVRAQFTKQFSRDMIADIRSEVSGKLESLLAGLAYAPGEYDAYVLHKAISGVGTDDAVVVEHLSHRTNEEMAAIKEAYVKLSGKTLELDLEGDLSGDFKLLCMALVKGVRQDRGSVQADVKALYKSGEGRMGTDEQGLIDILAGSSAAYLEQLRTGYAQAHGHSLLVALKKEVGGGLLAGLGALATHPDEYYADLINDCIKGTGTDTARLIRLLVSRRNQLPGIGAAFLKLTQRTMAARVGEEESGDLKLALTTLLAGL